MKQIGCYPTAGIGDIFEIKAGRRATEVILSTCHVLKVLLSIFRAGSGIPTAHSRAELTWCWRLLSLLNPPFSFSYPEIQIK